MIFKCKSLTEYLNSLFQDKKKRNSLFSLRSWSKYLGYKSPSYLLQVMNGDRTANINLLRSIRKTEKLKKDEDRYLQLLFLKQNYADVQDLNIFSMLENQLKPEPFDDLFLEKFGAFSNWYSFYIMGLTHVKGFVVTKESICDLLSPYVDEFQVEDTLESLLALGHIKKEKNRYFNGKNHWKVDSPAISRWLLNLSFITHARDVFRSRSSSLHSTNANEIDFNCQAMLLSLSEDGYKKVTEALEEFYEKIQHIAEVDVGQSQIFQLSHQFFNPNKKAKNS